MKNDLAYILSGTLSMYEHQSTYSPNLPVQFLVYLAQEYQTVIERTARSLYGAGQISLPTPQCVVFFNGTKEMPEEHTLKLSDAFENKKVSAGQDTQEELNMAIEYCIENGILKEFLSKNRAEVLGMLLEEFDAEKYRRTIREEGMKKGEIKVNRLGLLLTEAGRNNDFIKSLSDRELQKRLFIEFGLEEQS